MRTWQDLCDASPEFQSLARDARSIAKNARGEWYARWLPASRDFHDCVRRVADGHGWDYQSVRFIALAGLLDAYNVERQRRARRGK